MKLTEIIQAQNDSIGALENSTLEDNLITPQIAKVYDDFRVTIRITVLKANYYVCGEVNCNVDQLTTKESEKRYY